MRVEAVSVSVALQIVAIPRLVVCVLRPDVRQLVLVELEHLLKRREVVWLGFSKLEDH